MKSKSALWVCLAVLVLSFFCGSTTANEVAPLNRIYFVDTQLARIEQVALPDQQTLFFLFFDVTGPSKVTHDLSYSEIVPLGPAGPKKLFFCHVTRTPDKEGPVLKAVLGKPVQGIALRQPPSGENKPVEPLKLQNWQVKDSQTSYLKIGTLALTDFQPTWGNVLDDTIQKNQAAWVAAFKQIFTIFEVKAAKDILNSNNPYTDNAASALEQIDLPEALSAAIEFDLAFVFFNDDWMNLPGSFDTLVKSNDLFLKHLWLKSPQQTLEFIKKQYQGGRAARIADMVPHPLVFDYVLSQYGAVSEKEKADFIDMLCSWACEFDEYFAAFYKTELTQPYLAKSPATERAINHIAEQQAVFDARAKASLYDLDHLVAFVAQNWPLQKTNDMVRNMRVTVKGKITSVSLYQSQLEFTADGYHVTVKFAPDTDTLSSLESLGLEKEVTIEGEMESFGIYADQKTKEVRFELKYVRVAQRPPML